jgi:hypothetical protein
MPDMLTLEEALKFEERTEVPEWHTQESFIKYATQQYNASVNEYNKELLHINNELDKTLADVGEKRTDIIIKTETLEEYLYSSGPYIRFTAWSEKYIYVQVRQNYTINIVAIPKSPSKPLEVLGGA